MSTNDGGHVIKLHSGTRDEEMNALDALGPLTRQMIHNMPLRWSALAITRQIQDFEDKQRLKFPEHVRHLFKIDPKDPRFDQMVADQLVEQALDAVRKDRSEEDAQMGVTPLRARYSVKSLREQRRSKRASRW